MAPEVDLTYTCVHACTSKPTRTDTYLCIHTPNEFVLFKLVKTKRFFFSLQKSLINLLVLLSCDHSYCCLLVAFYLATSRRRWFWLFPNLQAFTVILCVPLRCTPHCIWHDLHLAPMLCPTKCSNLILHNSCPNSTQKCFSGNTGNTLSPITLSLTYQHVPQ